MKRSLFRKTGYLAAATVLIWLTGYFMFLAFVFSLPPPPENTRTDSIIVLTGGPHRINTGLDLLSAGLSGNLFISGVDTRVTSEKLIALWSRDSGAGGELPCCIILGHEAQNTKQNAGEARLWAVENNVKSVRLVTSEYHIPRAWLEFRLAMPDIELLLHPVDSEVKKRVFLRLAFGEYNKTLLTGIYHLLNFDD